MERLNELGVGAEGQNVELRRAMYIMRNPDVDSDNVGGLVRSYCCN